MATSYRVTAPYVTLKVKDLNGLPVVVGYYEGAIVSDVDAESLKAHLDSGMVEKVSASEVPTSGDEGGKAAPKSSSK